MSNVKTYWTVQFNTLSNGTGDWREINSVHYMNVPPDLQFHDNSKGKPYARHPFNHYCAAAPVMRNATDKLSIAMKVAEIISQHNPNVVFRVARHEILHNTAGVSTFKNGVGRCVPA